MTTTTLSWWLASKHRIILLHPLPTSYPALAVCSAQADMALCDSVGEQRPADANSGRMNIPVYLLIYRHSLLSWKGPIAQHMLHPATYFINVKLWRLQKRQRQHRKEQFDYLSIFSFPTTTLMSSLTTCPGSEQVGQGDRYLEKALHIMYPGEQGIKEILQGVLFVISLVWERWDFASICPVMKVWELRVTKFYKSILFMYHLHPFSIRVSNWSSHASFCPSFSFNSQNHFYLNAMQFSMVMLKMFQFCSTDEWNSIFLYFFKKLFIENYYLRHFWGNSHPGQKEMLFMRAWKQCCKHKAYTNTKNTTLFDFWPNIRSLTKCFTVPHSR